MEGQAKTEPVRAAKKAEDRKACPFFAIGTPQCGLLLALVGFVFALLLVFIGFWRTLLVALLTGLGYFIGTSKNKSASLKRAVNKIIPPKAD